MMSGNIARHGEFLLVTASHKQGGKNKQSDNDVR